MKNKHLTKDARMKKTNIVGTIGPASQDLPVMRELVRNGMNVIRMNFSHGDFSTHQKTLNNARKIAKELDTTVTTLQDLCGPKIRVGEMPEGGIELKPGKKITLTTKQQLGSEKVISINYKKLPKEVSKGQSILIEDGKKLLKVISTNNKDQIVCKIVVGGIVKSRKGVNVPGARLSLKSLTKKDKIDLEFGIKNKVDYVAMSFVRSAADIKELKKILEKAGSRAHVLAKIETQEAIEDFDAILAEVDAIMVARGDLSVEVGHEKVPVLQKMITEKCIVAGKPVIIATQMLDSMENNPVPTRAEASDVANGIMDEVDAIMLSGETSIGDYPVEAVSLMSSIACQCESAFSSELISIGDRTHRLDALVYSAMRIADDIDAAHIVALTSSGNTVRKLAAHRPSQNITAFTYSHHLVPQLALLRGVHAAYLANPKTFEKALGEIRTYLKNHGQLKKGDKVIVIGGRKLGISGGTNSIHVLEW